MKRLCIIVLAVIGVAVTAEAQTVSFGPRVGVNFATLRVVDAEDEYRKHFNDALDYTTGAQFGAVVNFEVSEILSVQPEILYSQRGYQANPVFHENSSNGSASVNSRMNFLEVPVLAKFSFGVESIKGFVTAGPSVSYFMNGKMKYAFDGKEEEEDYEFNDYVNGIKANRLDIGANVGAGMAFALGTGALNLDVRYGLGLSDISKYEANRPSDKPKSVHRMFGVSVAYLFRGK